MPNLDVPKLLSEQDNIVSRALQKLEQPAATEQLTHFYVSKGPGRVMQLRETKQHSMTFMVPDVYALLCEIRDSAIHFKSRDEVNSALLP